MEKRTITFSVLAVAIALSGYAVGFAKTQESTATTSLEQAKFLGRLPTYSYILIADENAKELNVTDAERMRFKEETKDAVQEYLVAQKSLWYQQIQAATLAEEGETLNTSGNLAVGGMYELREFEKMERPLSSADALISSTAFKIFGPDRIKKFIEKSLERRDAQKSVGYDILFNPVNGSAIGLSPAQQNQLILFEAYFAFMQQHENTIAPATFKLEEVLPDQAKNRQIAAKATPDSKNEFYWRTIQNLSPLQRLRLQAMINDKVYAPR